MKALLILGWTLFVFWLIGWGICIWLDNRLVWETWGVYTIPTVLVWIIVAVRWNQIDYGSVDWSDQV